MALGNGRAHAPDMVQQLDIPGGTIIEPLAGDEHEVVTIIGTNHPDTIRAGGGPQQIFGLNGPDTIDGGGGPDEIHGGNGDDLLVGSGGPDMLFGDNGDDRLIGGHGPDILTGGRGDDLFIFLAPNDAPAHGEEAEGGSEEVHDGDDGGGQETITDFKPGSDQIDLSAIGGLVGFSPDGPAAYSIWAVQQGDDAMLLVDTDGAISGDHPAEMGILLLGIDAGALSAGDFIV